MLIIYITNTFTQTHAYIYIYCYCYCYCYFGGVQIIPSRNLNEVFTYNHMALISLRSRYHVKASIVLTRPDHLFIYYYIRSLLNNILKPFCNGPNEA